FAIEVSRALLPVTANQCTVAAKSSAEFEFSVLRSFPRKPWRTPRSRPLPNERIDARYELRTRLDRARIGRSGRGPATTVKDLSAARQLFLDLKVLPWVTHTETIAAELGRASFGDPRLAKSWQIQRRFGIDAGFSSSSIS